MTGVLPLQSIHKKGLFGNHHKKEESNLLKISEVRGLSIIQVVKYKKSTVKLSEILIDNLKFPEKNLSINSNKETRILWSGPNTWFLVSYKEDIIKTIEKKCSNKDFAITDLSHSRVVIQIKGFYAKEILKKGCPININDFKTNSCAGTVFQGINIFVDMLDENPETFNLFALRSFGESFYHDITDAALEYGYLGV